MTHTGKKEGRENIGQREKCVAQGKGKGKLKGEECERTKGGRH